MSAPFVTLLDPLEAMLHGPTSAALRVGLVIPQSGVLGLTGPSALDAAILAAGEINADGESQARPVEFVLVDSGGAPSAVAHTAAGLAKSGAVDAFIGLHTSQTLVSMEQAIGGRVPYVFAAGFEDTRLVPGIYCPGETPAQFAPGLTRVMAERGVTQWAIIGTDYVWPRAARLVERATIAGAGGQVVLDHIMPLNGVSRGASEVVDAVLAAGAHGILINMPGRDLVTMLRTIRSRGLDKRLVRVSGCLEENTLYAIGGDTSGNLYASMHSFDSLMSSKRLELNDRHRVAFGEAAPILNAWAEHCYDSVHLLAQLERRGLLSMQAFAAQMSDVGDSSSEGLRQSYEQYLAVAEGLSFTVL